MRFLQTILAFVWMTSPLMMWGQYSSDSRGSFLAEEKPVSDYFEKVDDRSFYQQQRIHGLKSELNNYSSRLHTLQQRFDQIFYGLSSQGKHSTPFELSNSPQKPVYQQRTYESNYSTPASFTPSPTPRPVAPQSVPQELQEQQQPVRSQTNQLAFSVDAPGKYSKEGKVASLFDPEQASRESLGGYLVISPGFSIPFKTHEGDPSVHKSRHRKYDPGVSVNIAGGLEKNPFRVGVGVSYKRHSLDDDSYEVIGGPNPINPISGHSQTVAGYLDLGLRTPIASSLDAYMGVGLGYYLSLIEDPRKRKDHGFFATGSLGLAWNVTDLIALRFGYRYLHEDEVPSHVAELGLNFDF
ncbi:MAG: outer membrane beta-barrel protein [Opitutales bacterium]